MNPPDLYLYFDFRRYLEDWREWQKSQGKKVTLEDLGEWMGLKSRGQVSLILSGQRNLTWKQANILAQKLDFNAAQGAYFEALVFFTQAKTHHEKKAFLDRMVQILGGEGRILDLGQAALCEKWFYPVVRELIRIHKIRAEDYDRLAELVRPRITEREAERALQVLKQIGLAFINHKGYWQATDSVLRFPEGVRSTVLRQFQRDTLQLAIGALDKIPPQEREIGSLTISVSLDRYTWICERIREFRRELTSLVCSDPSDPELVAQVTLACVPVSMPSGNKPVVNISERRVNSGGGQEE